MNKKASTISKQSTQPGVRLQSFSGSHREIGRAHGEENRELIAEFLGMLRENSEAKVRVKAGRKLMSDLLRKHWSYSIEYDANLGEEIEGIAEGAKLDLFEIVYLNAFLDIINTRDDRVAAALLGCTSFGVNKEASKNSGCIVGQNYDMEAFYRKFTVIQEIAPSNEPAVLVYTYVGIVGCAGMNNRGLGLAINFLHPNDASYGVVYPFVVRKILSQERIGDAIGAATIGYRAGGTNFLIGDKEGMLFDIETSARDHDILFPNRGVLAHSNHYISSKMQKYDLVVWDGSYDSSIPRRGSTMLRWYVVDQALKNNSGSIDIAYLSNLCCDHTNYPFSVCFHGDEHEADLFRGETNGTMILDLHEVKMHFTAGSPCHGVSQTIQFSH